VEVGSANELSSICKESKMKQNRLSRIISVLVAVVCLNPLLPVIAARPLVATPSGQHYTMIDLTPDGSAGASIAGTSGAQQVGSAGFVTDTPTGPSVVNHAMVWSGDAGSAIDLGVGTAMSISNGQQAGSVNTHAALWNGTAESLIDLHPSAWDQSAATGIAAGQQVGWASRRTVCGECGGGVKTIFSMRPFLWSGSAASVTDLTPFNLGFGAGQALATDGVQQVGYAQQVLSANAFSGPYAMLWSGTADSAVNLNPVGSIESQAKAVFGGQQVGYGFAHHALMWRGSAASFVDLHPAGYVMSEASATNGVQQVGFGIVSTGSTVVAISHALVWTGSAASVVDLNQFLPSGFTESAATGIDAAGNIVGWASTGLRTNPANLHAVIWVPSDAPSLYAQSLSLSQTTTMVGDVVQATVTLNQPAPVGGAVVSLASPIYPSAVSAPFTVTMPASITVAEGQTSASFTVATAATTLTGFSRPYLVVTQAAYGDTVETAILIINPPVYATSLAVTPRSLTGGDPATGTVTLNSAAPAGGAQVTLASNNPAVSVPATVTVPAGQLIATFPIQTSVVATFTTVTLTAVYGSVIPATVTASLQVAPPPVPVDTVAIQKADYVVSKKELNVQATSTSQTAILTVTVTATGEVIGTLTNKGAGSYAAKLAWPVNPRNITVTSSLSGAASQAVNLK
jgi:hypothetical protein